MATNPNTTATPTAASETDIKDRVRDALRQHKIKLWLDPYYISKDNDAGEPSVTALESLVEQWMTVGICQRDDRNLVLEALQEWQLHALEKLRTKQKQQTLKQVPGQSPTSVTAVVATAAAASPSVARLKSDNECNMTTITLEIKILGLTKEMESLLETSKMEEEDNGFAMTIKTSKCGNGATAAPVVLRLEGVVSQRTDKELLDYLKKQCQSSNVRLIYRGKNIAPDNGAPTTLGTIFQDSFRQQTSNSEAVLSLMCLVSNNPPSGDNNNNDRNSTKEQDIDIHTRIASIRDAARQIRDATNLEITDQHGSTVPMTKEDRLGFLTALALHRMGLHYSMSNKQDSLVLLLEADAEWNRHPHLGTWKDQVDNYGLLQLDIAWAYLQLESLSNLPDSLRRLEEAERVLRKQVHVNFVTLALTQAEAGNATAVPPLAAVFAKLFLLQGIAHAYNSNGSSSSCYQKGKTCLDQAFVLLHSLRSLAPEESVQSLLDVVRPTSRMEGYAALHHGQNDFFTRSDAIAALRKAQGDLNAAAMTLSEGAAERRRRHRDRDVQNQHGTCANETDPVELNQVDLLKSMLCRDESTTTAGAEATQSWLEGGENTELAVGLLRLSNNDMSKALDLYRDNGYDSSRIHTLVEALDERLVQRGLLNRKTLARKKQRRLRGAPQTPPVDEVALATLLSVGLDQTRARQALQKNRNDVEKALIWLSTDESTDKAKNTSAAADDVSQGNNDNHMDEEHKMASQGDPEGNQMGEETTSDSESRDAKQNHYDQQEWSAQELLRQELGGILEERDLEKEYLGNSLDEEWRLVQKYRPSE